MFNPCQPCPVTPFTRKLNWYLQGSLEEKEALEKEQFDGFIERILQEQLEEGESNPVRYDANSYFELELRSVNNISIAVADNPFIKSDMPKYFPECFIVSGMGEIIGHIAADSKASDFENIAYMENFRDDALKFNDDRKITMNLQDFEDPHTCIFMMVRVNENKKTASKHYEQAWFRLQNEDTNQTLDYSKFSQIAVPDGLD